MKKLKIVSLVISLVLVSALAFVGVANAQGIKTGNNVNVATGETVDSMLFAAGNNIDIAGTVNGDVYCAGQTISISGTVNGDVFCAGQTINLSGKINGSVRLAGQTVNLNGSVSSSATVAGQDFVMDTTASIGRDLLGGVATATINGTVTRDITAGVQNLTVNGMVGRDITSDVETLNIGSSAKVAGNVMYTSKNQLNVASGGVVAGTTTRSEPKNENQMRPEMTIAFAIASSIVIFIATIVSALAIALMFPKILENSASATMKSPGMTALTGFVAMIVAPIAIVILFVTVVGFPLALIAMMAWGIVMLLSFSFAAYLLGKLILRKSTSPLLVMLLGIGLVALAMLVPVLDIIVFFAAGIFGGGAILVQAKKLFERPSIKKA